MTPEELDRELRNPRVTLGMLAMIDGLTKKGVWFGDPAYKGGRPTLPADHVDTIGNFWADESLVVGKVRRSFGWYGRGCRPRQLRGQRPTPTVERARWTKEFTRKSVRERTNDALERSQSKLQRREAKRVLALVDGYRAVCEEGDAKGEKVGRDHMMVRAWLVHASRKVKMHRRTTAHVLDAALELEHRLPQLWAAFLNGESTWASVDTALSQSAGLDAEHLPAFDEKAVALVKERPTGEVKRTLRRFRERVQASSAVTRTRQANQMRRVGLEGLSDGQGELSVHGPVAPLVGINDALTKQAIAAHGKDGEDRTIGQLRHDIAVDALLVGLALPREAEGGLQDDRSTGGTTAGGTNSATASGHDPSSVADSSSGDDSSTQGDSSTTAAAEDVASGDAPRPVERAGVVAKVYLTIPALTLLGVGAEPARLTGYGPIDIETAKRLAGTAKAWTRVLTDPITGDPLRIDSRARRVPKAIRNWLEVVCDTCQGLGCTRPGWLCDHDHRKEWAKDGRTRVDNTNVLCRPNHGLRHSEYFDTSPAPRSALDWHSAWGATFRSEPPDAPEPAPLDALRDLYPEDPPF